MPKWLRHWNPCNTGWEDTPSKMVTAQESEKVWYPVRPEGGVDDAMQEKYLKWSYKKIRKQVLRRRREARKPKTLRADDLTNCVLVDRGEMPGTRSLYINQPKSIANVLDRETMRQLAHYLQIYERHDSVRGIFLRGLGKHFCRGRNLHDFGALRKKDPEKAVKSLMSVLRNEYQLYHQIRSYGLPVTICMHGDLVSSGAGLAMSAQARLAAHGSTFSVGDAAYGWFPDCGASWYLPRLKYPGTGMWMALTGTKLDPWGMKSLGIATHIVAYPETLEDIRDRLGDSAFLKREKMREAMHFAISDYEDVDAEINPLMDQLALIELCFAGAPDSTTQSGSRAFAPAHSTLQSVLDRLEALSQGDLEGAWRIRNKLARKVDGKTKSKSSKTESPESDWTASLYPPALRAYARAGQCPESVQEWAAEQLKAIGRMSPMSVKLTFQLLQEGSKAINVEECMKMEVRLAYDLMTCTSDFWEGVSARLESRDPKWLHSGLASVAHGDLADLLPSLEKVRKGDEEQFAAVAKHNEMLEMEREQANATKNADGGIQVNEKVALNLDELFSETDKPAETAHVNTNDSQKMNESTNVGTKDTELAENLDVSGKSAENVSENTDNIVNSEGTERLGKNIDAETDNIEKIAENTGVKFEAPEDVTENLDANTKDTENIAENLDASIDDTEKLAESHDANTECTDTLAVNPDGIVAKMAANLNAITRDISKSAENSDANRENVIEIADANPEDTTNLAGNPTNDTESMKPAESFNLDAGNLSDNPKNGTKTAERIRPPLLPYFLEVAPTSPPHRLIHALPGYTWEGGVHEGEVHEEFLSNSTEDNRFLSQPNPEYSRRHTARDEKRSKKLKRAEKLIPRVEKYIDEGRLGKSSAEYKDSSATASVVKSSLPDIQRILKSSRSYDTNVFDPSKYAYLNEEPETTTESVSN
eukprot:821390_1